MNINLKNTLYLSVSFLAGVLITLLILDRTATKIEVPAIHMEKESAGTMQHDMNSMTSGLSGKTGEEFDKAYISEMIIHHQGAIDMSKQALTSTKRPEILDLANQVIVAQEAEIKLMQQWQKDWGY